MAFAFLVFNLLLGWSLTACIWLSALFIMVYILLGGLSSSIYSETLQFFLIVASLLPLTIIGLINVGGWTGLQQKVNNPAFFHLWAGTATNNNPFGVNFIGIVLGLAIAPGLIVLSVLPNLGHGGGFQNSYNMAIPFAMAHYFPSGILGLGLTALIASFMSGMAGEATCLSEDERYAEAISVDRRFIVGV